MVAVEYLLVENAVGSCELCIHIYHRNIFNLLCLLACCESKDFEDVVYIGNRNKFVGAEANGLFVDVVEVDLALQSELFDSLLVCTINYNSIEDVCMFNLVTELLDFGSEEFC